MGMIYYPPLPSGLLAPVKEGKGPALGSVNSLMAPLPAPSLKMWLHLAGGSREPTSLSLSLFLFLSLSLSPAAKTAFQRVHLLLPLFISEIAALAC